MGNLEFRVQLLLDSIEKSSTYLQLIYSSVYLVTSVGAQGYIHLDDICVQLSYNSIMLLS